MMTPAPRQKRTLSLMIAQNLNAVPFGSEDKGLR